MERLETARLILRPFVPNDVEDFFKITRDEDVKKYVYNACPNDLEQAKYDIETYYSQGDFFHDFYFVIEHKDNHEMIGFLIATQNLNYEFEVCVMIERHHRHQGYITEAQNKFFDILPKGSVLVFEVECTNMVSLQVVRKIPGVEEIRIPDADIRRFIKII